MRLGLDRVAMAMEGFGMTREKVEGEGTVEKRS